MYTQTDHRSSERETLKSIILELHAGRRPEELKGRFRELLQRVGATQIAELESELIAAGLPEEEVKRLCDVHVQVFEEALEAQVKPETVPGHPVHTFRQENQAVAAVVEKLRSTADQLARATGPMEAGPLLAALRDHLAQLAELEKHYVRKEHLLFPHLEKHGIKGPSTVMWGLHDDIRAAWKGLRALLSDGANKDWQSLIGEVQRRLPPLLEMVSSMIYKEENILFPMSLERLSEEEWLAIQGESDDIGYTLITPGAGWPKDKAVSGVGREVPSSATFEAEANITALSSGRIALSTGALTLKELDLMLTHLPIDITFVDKDDIVRYFSAGRERIFVRTEAAIGRQVQNCHPPKSLHIVERILSEFKAGTRDVAEFWIPFRGKSVHIRYFAVRDAAGEYQGTLEVTQDITSIRELQGERRLLSES